MTLLESIYHLSGIISALVSLIVVFMLFRSNKDYIRSRIFLKYSEFKWSFFILAAGFTLNLIGSLMGFINHHMFHFLHEIGEVCFNVGIFVFLVMMLMIFKKNNPIKE